MAFGRRLFLDEAARIRRSRALRFITVLAIFLGVTLLARRGAAQSEEDAPSPEVALIRVRRALVAKDLLHARRLIDDLPNAGVAPVMVDDLRLIADRWIGMPAPASTSSEDASSPWQASFLAARERLARRAYHEATRSFAALRASPPDRASEARARAMHLLASESAAEQDAETRRDREAAEAERQKAEKAREHAREKAFAPDEPDPKSSVTRWYGWQTLLADTASTIVFPLDTSSPVCPGCLMYFIGGPIVHAFHARPMQVFMSAAMRVGAPLTTGAIGCFGVRPLMAFGGGGGGCPDNVVYVGAGVGVVIAMAVDAAVFARERVAVPDRAPRTTDRGTSARAEPRRGAPITPSIAPRREGGIDLGIAGTF